MPISMYAIAVPTFQKQLNALDAILDKADGLRRQRKRSISSVLLSARLYPDMFNFTRQVQGAADFAKAAGARLAGRAGAKLPGYRDDDPRDSSSA